MDKILISQMWNIRQPSINHLRKCNVSNFSICSQSKTKNTTNDGEKKTINASIYRKEGIFNSKTLLAEHLKRNIIFNDIEGSGLIAINKPFGLGLLPGDNKDISLTCALPELASALEVQNLSVIKSSGKFISGCTLLNAGSEKTHKHVSNCINRHQANKQLGTKYLAITNGIPRTSGKLETVDVSLEKIKTKKSLKGGDFKEPVIHRELVSKTRLQKFQRKSNDAKHQQINRFTVLAEILAKSRGNLTALVSIQPTGIQWNFMCAYMANLLSPIIGDSQFSYRVKTLFGQQVKVSHESSPVGNASSGLPRSIMGQLGMSLNDVNHIPVHLHHFRTHLPGFYGKENLNIYAPVPKYFEYSVNALEISVDFKALETKDQIFDISQHKNGTANEIL